MTTHMTGTPGTADSAFIAGLLQSTLLAKRVNSIVSLAWDGPQLRVYAVTLALGETPEAVERLSGALAMAAGAESCRVGRDAGRVLLEIAKPAAERGVLRANRLEQFAPPTPTSVALGIGVHGRVVWHDMATEGHAHTVVGGTTGSGKTVLLRWLLLRLCVQNSPEQLRLVIMDPKGFELREFRQSAHLLHPVESHPLQCVRLLQWVTEEVHRRAQTGTSSPRLVVVVEEVADLTAQNRDIVGQLERIAQMGRALGVHLVATTQQPGSAALGRALVNFPARILGRVSSSTLTYGAAGRGRTGAEDLLGRGDFLLLAAGEQSRFQAPLADGRQWAQLPRAHQVATLEDVLPTLVEFGDRNRDTRGGRGRRELSAADYARMEAAVANGATVEDLRGEFGVGWTRAARIVGGYAEATR